MGLEELQFETGNALDRKYTPVQTSQPKITTGHDVGFKSNTPFSSQSRG